MSDELELVSRVRRGDAAALSELVALIKDLVFNLAIRMLGNPADAEDASQEILIRIVSGLGEFRGESALRTWVYRVAANHLLTARKRRTEEYFESLDTLVQALDAGLADSAPPVEEQVLVTEAKLHCTSHMMLGLDREHRLAFILGEVLDLGSEEAAAVLEIKTEAFRKRLSRARERMAAFTSSHCGLVDPKNPCRCAKQIGQRIACGVFERSQRPFTRYANRPKAKAKAELDALDNLGRALEVFRNHPDYVAPDVVAKELRTLIEKTPFSMP